MITSFTATDTLPLTNLKKVFCPVGGFPKWCTPVPSTHHGEGSVSRFRNLFILGCPRSGTTMLQQALNRHPQVVIPPETKFFFSFFGHCYKCQQRHAARLNADLKISLPPLTKAVESLSEARRYYSHMSALYVDRLQRRDVLFFGEKTPEHTSQFSVISRCFPRAKFILIYRDGRDVAVSLTKVPWMRRDLYLGFCVWLYYYHQQMRALRSPTIDLCCVKYEDLVQHPHRELERLTAFLGISFDPVMAEGHGNQEGIPNRELPWKARALKPISDNRIGVWRHELASEEIAVLERLGNRPLRSLAYELSTNGRAPLAASVVSRILWNSTAFLSKIPMNLIMNNFFGRGWCVH